MPGKLDVVRSVPIFAGLPDAKLEVTSVMEIVIEGMDGKWHPPASEV